MSLADRRTARARVDALRAESVAADAALREALSVAAGALRVARADREARGVALRAAAARLATGSHDFAPWLADRWTDFPGEPRMPAELRVGEIDDEIPATVPVFDGRPIVVASDTESGAAHARQLLRSLAARTALALGDRVVLHLIDPDQAGFGFPERALLPQDAPRTTSAAADLRAVAVAASEFQSRHHGIALRDLPDAERAREKLHVVIALDFPHGYDYAATEALNAVARLGPAGVQLIVHDRIEAGGAQRLALDRAVAMASDRQGVLSGPWGSLTARADAAPHPDLLRLLIERMPAQAPAPEAVLDWADLNDIDPAHWWTESAQDGIAAVFGRAADGEPLRLVFGTAAGGVAGSHAVVGGTTGSGKSELLHAVVLSLSTRYSPEQLRLFLLDGQSGVTTQAYTELPHTELVGIDSPVDLMRGVLTDLAGELDRRDALLVRAGVDRIGEFWNREGPAAMPRLVVVIDEYQRLFEGDRRDETAAILQRIAAQGRKIGVHLLLLSQRFHATGLHNQAALFDNVGTRLSLQLNEDAIPFVDEFGSAGRELIRRHATAPGRVVLNAQGGRDSGNVAGAVAAVPQSLRDTLPPRLTEKARSAGVPASAEVFRGKEQPRVADSRALRALAAADISSGRSLREWAESPARDGGLAATTWPSYARPLPFIVGRTFSAHGAAHCRVERSPRQNVLIVADDPEVLTGMMLTGIAGMGLAVERAGLTVSVLGELPQAGESWDAALTDGLPRLLGLRGHRSRAAVTPADGVLALDEATAELERRAAGGLTAEPPLLVAAVGLDRVPAFQSTSGRYGPELSESATGLLRLLSEGPMLGIHVTLGFTSRTAFAVVFPGKEAAQFAHRLVQQMSEDDSRRLLDSHFGYGIMPPGVGGPARAGYTNAADPTRYVFLPYSTAGGTSSALEALHERK